MLERTSCKEVVKPSMEIAPNCQGLRFEYTTLDAKADIRLREGTDDKEV